MTGSAEGRPTQKVDLLALFASIALCLSVSAVGGAITATSVGNWYQTLEKPSFTPPDWLFAPVWTCLYVLMGISSWRIWVHRSFVAIRSALTVFGIQLFLNLAWSFLFFGLQRVDLALLEIVILFTAIITNTVVFWRIERLAGLMFLPYAAWVAYAAAINASLWLQNTT